MKWSWMNWHVDEMVLDEIEIWLNGIEIKLSKNYYYGELSLRRVVLRRVVLRRVVLRRPGSLYTELLPVEKQRFLF